MVHLFRNPQPLLYRVLYSPLQLLRLAQPLFLVSTLLLLLAGPIACPAATAHPLGMLLQTRRDRLGDLVGHARFALRIRELRRVYEVACSAAASANVGAL